MAIHRQDDRTEPSAGDTSDQPLQTEWAGERAELPAKPVCEPLTPADIELLAQVDEAHEKSGKRKARFPLSHLLFFLPKRIRNEAWRRIASLPPPGSFFD
jgi:hypothetical protein